MQTTRFLTSLVWSHSGGTAAKRPSISILLFVDPDTRDQIVDQKAQNETYHLARPQFYDRLSLRHKDGGWYVQWGERSLSTSGGFLE